jgi:hypothetical protein
MRADGRDDVERHEVTCWRGVGLVNHTTRQAAPATPPRHAGGTPTDGAEVSILRNFLSCACKEQAKNRRTVVL